LRLVGLAQTSPGDLDLQLGRGGSSRDEGGDLGGVKINAGRKTGGGGESAGHDNRVKIDVCLRVGKIEDKAAAKAAADVDLRGVADGNARRNERILHA
jgi:hypothetical protein